MKNEALTKHKTIKDVVNVSASNILKLLSGVLVGLLLPKIIGVTDYGYYKTFTLYTSYVGLFMFGIGDGIYLKYGGLNYSDIPKPKFRFYSRSIIVVQLLISLVLLMLSVFLQGEYRSIFAFVSVYLLFANVTGYYQIVSQITSRFSEFSRRTILQSVYVSIVVFTLWLFHRVSQGAITYWTFTFLYVCGYVIFTVWYIYTYKDITFGKECDSNNLRNSLIGLVKLGLPLTVANLCSSLILTIDRQFVNVLFDTDTYAIYAFAYNLLSLITTATTAIAVVIYPKMKKLSADALKNSYEKMNMIILTLVFFCMTIYFPLCPFIRWFLPKYSDSLLVFRVIFPGLAISSSITIVMHNCYKVWGINTSFFYKSVVVLICSCIANIIAYYLFSTTVSISIASIISMFLWYVIVEYKIIKDYKLKWLKNFTYMLIMITGFYIISSFDNAFICSICYLFVLLIVCLILYRDYINVLFRKCH